MSKEQLADSASNVFKYFLKICFNLSTCLMLWVAATFDDLRQVVTENKYNTDHLTKVVDGLKKNSFVTHNELDAKLNPIIEMLQYDHERLNKRTEFMSDSKVKFGELSYMLKNHSHN